MRQIRSLLNVDKYGVSLDWVTFSSIPEASAHADFHSFSHEVMKQRFERFPLREKAYIKDYAGESIGGFTSVRRERDGHMQMWASGEDTQTLIEELLNAGIPARCKRIDIAVTARCKRANDTYPERVRAHCKRKRRETGAKLGKAMGLFNDKDGDTGITLGVRGTAKYGRIYDWERKHCRTSTQTIWRHELELRKLASERYWEQYQKHPDRQALNLATAHYEFSNWHLPCEWMGKSGKNVVSATPEETTDDKRLIHLNKSVLPFIAKLVESGREEEVRAAIKAHGLDGLFNR